MHEEAIVPQKTTVEKVQKSISWNTLEFEKKERHPDWPWYAGLVAVLAATLCFFYGNIFFGIFLILAGIVVIMYSRHDPKNLAITIDSKGVSINDSIIDYKKIVSFWLDETGKTDTLLLRVTDSFVPLLALPLTGVRADAVRDVLIQYAAEEELRQSRSIALFDRLGF